jgi:hypothetical protein
MQSRLRGLGRDLQNPRSFSQREVQVIEEEQDGAVGLREPGQLALEVEPRVLAGANPRLIDRH